MCNCKGSRVSARPAIEAAALNARVRSSAMDVARRTAGSTAMPSTPSAPSVSSLSAARTPAAAVSPAWRTPVQRPVTTIGATAVAQAATATNSAHTRVAISSQGPRQAGQVAAVSYPVTRVNSPKANQPTVSAAQLASISRFPNMTRGVFLIRK